MSRNRSIAELAALPDMAPVSIKEYCSYRNIGHLSTYYKRRRLGYEPSPVRLPGSRPQHTAAQMRYGFSFLGKEKSHV
jgi:hypothetical protein